MLAAVSCVGEAHIAEIDRIVRLYFRTKDEFEPVAATELLDRARKGLVTVLDVRPPEEFASGHVPGALNIPMDQLARRLRELPKGIGGNRILPRAVLPDVFRRGATVAQEGHESPQVKRWHARVAHGRFAR